MNEGNEPDHQAVFLYAYLQDTPGEGAWRWGLMREGRRLVGMMGCDCDALYCLYKTWFWLPSSTNLYPACVSPHLFIWFYYTQLHFIALLCLHRCRIQDRVRAITAAFYRDGPGGLAGNDDAGQISSWYVLTAMGLYQVREGVAVFVLSWNA